MKKIILILCSIFITIYLNAFYKNNDFYYSVDIPDSWNIDDSVNYDVIISNENKDLFVEIFVLDLNAVPTNNDVLKAFVDRFNMKGSSSNITFCNYKAIKGDYSFNLNGVDVNLTIVVFKDNYFYYVPLAYTYSNKYNNYKNTMWKIINSMKIYYDNDVVYGNDSSSTNIVENTKNNSFDESNKSKDSGEYDITMEWDKYKKVFVFKVKDLQDAEKEVTAIVNPSVWQYFGIDTYNDPDYNFTFWKKFYQEMFNKNFYRINHIADFFRKEAQQRGWNSYELAYQVIKSVQNIPYERPYNIVTDKTKGANILDYFTPNEIAWYKKGDCDTKSMFIVLILRSLGYDACLYYSAEYGHAMVGLNINASGTYKEYNNNRYYFVESTYPGWKIGDLPPQMSDTKKWRIIPIK
ncbi:MAG TPA: hypothetical protein PLE45_07075 [Spirochaetota bacterium]|nr:hypothetical protein [Spirochaetota bacterium]HPP04553.1 hypothetical protein [Spirochaetota bacterium]